MQVLRLVGDGAADFLGLVLVLAHRLEAELAGDQLDLVEVEALIDGDHQAEILEREADDLRRRDLQDLRELADGDELVDADELLLALDLGRRAWPRPPRACRGDRCDRRAWARRAWTPSSWRCSRPPLPDRPRRACPSCARCGAAAPPAPAPAPAAGRRPPPGADGDRRVRVGPPKPPGDAEATGRGGNGEPAVTGRGRGAPGVMGRGRGRSLPAARRDGEGVAARGVSRRRRAARVGGRRRSWRRRALPLLARSCSRPARALLPAAAAAAAAAACAARAAASWRSASRRSASRALGGGRFGGLLRDRVGGGLLGGDFGGGGGDVGRLAAAANLAAARRFGARRRAPARPRRPRWRRRDDGARARAAPPASRRGRASPAPIARERAPPDHPSAGSNGCARERPSDEAIPSPRRRRSRTRQPCRVREACSNYPPMGLPRSPTPPARESLSRAADRRCRRPRWIPVQPRRRARRRSVPR